MISTYQEVDDGMEDCPNCPDLCVFGETACGSPKKRNRSKREQVNNLAECCWSPVPAGGHQSGREVVCVSTTVFSLQRDRPIARSSWPSLLRLNSCSSGPDQAPSSCNSSMCSSQTSSMTPSCSSPASQSSSMAPFGGSTYYSSLPSGMCITHSNASYMSTGTAMSDGSSTGISCWSNATHHISSRAAPGGALGEGIGWVIPEYGGREVLAEYEFGPTLGCGTFGVTRLVTHRTTACPWACKTICKSSIAASPAAVSDVQHEVAILQHLSGHSGIVQLQGVFEDERNIHLVMELCTGGDLLDYISRFGRLSEAEAADIAHVMLTTLQHCHKLGVVHRDIKPENFLLGAPSQLHTPQGSGAGVLKMSDFGVSAFYTPGENFSEIVGTPFYMAPEVLERNYGPAADVWSVGVVAYLMLAGCLPFNGNTDREVIKSVLDGPVIVNGAAWEGISGLGKDWVQKVLNKDPVKRPSISQLLQHPWLQGRNGSSGSSRNGSSRKSGTAHLQCSSRSSEPAGAAAPESSSSGCCLSSCINDSNSSRSVSMSCPGSWQLGGSNSGGSSSSSSYPGNPGIAAGPPTSSSKAGRAALQPTGAKALSCLAKVRLGFQLQ